jgi:hypothetical protein
MKDLNYFELMRNFWNFSFENPEKIKPTHIAIYFFAVEHCNRLGWKEKFGLPTSMVLDAIGIKSYSVYKKCFDDLVKWEFFKAIEYSKNQYSSNIIALKENNKAHSKALDKALIMHNTKQSESTDQSSESIIRQYTIDKEQKTIEQVFDWFWDLYDKKVDSKKCRDKFLKLNDDEINAIIKNIKNYIKSTPDKQYRKNPMTWLNGKCWDDVVYLEEKKIPDGHYLDKENRVVMVGFYYNKEGLLLRKYS